MLPCPCREAPCHRAPDVRTLRPPRSTSVCWAACGLAAVTGALHRGCKVLQVYLCLHPISNVQYLEPAISHTTYVYPYLYLSLYLYLYLCLYLSTYLPTDLPTYLPTYLIIYIHTYAYVLFLYSFVYLFLYPRLHLDVYISFYLYIHVSISIYTVGYLYIHVHLHMCIYVAVSPYLPGSRRYVYVSGKVSARLPRQEPWIPWTWRALV